MKTLIAIGGGSFQRGETRQIDEYAIHRTNKVNPNVLFLPSASRDDQGYAKRFKQYMRSLNCHVDVIRLFHTKLEKDEIKQRILSCDILYIGAGNLTLLMDVLKEFDLIDTVGKAYAQGIVCMGNSAGASCYFTQGYSDHFDDGEEFVYVKGMGIVDGCFCPHAQDERRKQFFQDQVNDKIYISCKDQSAYVFEDEKEFYFTSKAVD